jgi:hypothetical protein
LAAGQTIDLLCNVWCHPINGTAPGCAHQDVTAFASMTRIDDCKDAALTREVGLS